MAILILFSNSGWALSFHYCKDELASVSFSYVQNYEEDTDSCGIADSCCGEDGEHQDCCDDQTVESSKSDSNLITKVLELDLCTFILPNVLPTFNNINALKSKKSNIAFYVDLNAPPLYDLFCQLVFYA